MRTSRIVRTAFVLCAIAVLHCSLIAQSTLKSGIGESCAADSDCQNAICSQGVCASICATDTDCPSPSICLTGLCKLGCHVADECATGSLCLANVCTAPLRVAALLPGIPDGSDAWSTSQKIGLDDATSALPYVSFAGQPYLSQDDLRTGEEIDPFISQYAAQGAQVIITTSEMGTTDVLAQAQQFPNVTFLAMGATDNASLPNVGAYSGKAEQAWYAAGELSARVVTTSAQCIGMILPTPTNEIVRETNAFALGARHQQPNVKIVIRWLGATEDFAVAPQYPYQATTFGFDSATDGALYREELLAAQLVDLGCTLVGHRTDTQRVVVAIDQRFKGTLGSGFFSLGVDARDACRANVTLTGTWYPSCLGTVYWSWDDLYEKIFGQLHSGTWTPVVEADTFRTDSTSLTQLGLSPYPSLTGIESADAEVVLQDVANAGYDAVFEGPYSFDGQRNISGDGVPDANQSVAAGAVLSDNELQRMCWFVDGIYELPDPTVVSYGTLIPALVPYGPPISGSTTTLDPSDASSTKKYGDVITYVESLSEDPTQVMSCALN
jgi:basic membrane lipoprotein Med (substrate-binding protein (PBP1-ABC) superfamily)